MSVPSRSQDWSVGAAACLVGLGVGVTAVPLVGFLVGPLFGVAFAAGAALVASRAARPAVPALVVFALAFQNLGVATLMPHIETTEAFKGIRAMNFVFLASAWLWLMAWPQSEDDRLAAFAGLGRFILVALAMIGVYFLVGAAGNVTGAAIYLRNVASPLLMFMLAVVAAARAPALALRHLGVVAVLLLAWGYGELLAREPLMALVGGEDYIVRNTENLRESGHWLRLLADTGYVVRRYSEIQVVDLFNTPLLGDLGIQVYRLLGPNFHSISYAYGLTIAALLFYATGRWLLFALALPLILVIGSKGAMACLAVSLFGHWLRALPHRRAVAGVATLLVLYVVAGLAIGLRSGDYHVLGFFAGLRSFAANPIGAGLGAGGNLSGDMTVIDWSRAQAVGYTDYPVESAVGVLLSQMGIGAFAVFAAYLAIGLVAWRRLSGRPLEVFAIATVVTTVNGVFQEEALFAPLALGGILACLAVALCGVPAAQAGAPAPVPSKPRTVPA